MSEGQIIDIPEIKVKIVEHRAEVKICPHCKCKSTASFPEELINTVQYDKILKAGFDEDYAENIELYSKKGN